MALISALAMVLITLFVYGRVAGFDFINFDDNVYVYENPHVLSGLTAEGVKWALTAMHSATWQPITWISYMLDVSVHGPEPSGFHVTNLLLHLANVALLLLALRKITGDSWRSLFVAAVFALHPLQVEPVTWIASRKDLLSTFFAMITLLSYAHYVKRPSIARYVPLFVAFALSLMSKQMLVTLPFVLLLLDYWPLRRSSSGTSDTTASPRTVLPMVLEKLPLVALSLAGGTMAYLAHARGQTIAAAGTVPFSSRVGTAFLSYGSYLRKSIWPDDLAIYYAHPGKALSISAAVAAGLLLVAFSLFVVWRANRHRYLFVGWFWFVGTLVPVIGLVQVGGHSMADRFMYFPIIGLAVLLAWGMPDIAARLGLGRVMPPVLGGVWLIALCVCAWFQVGHWRDSVSIYEHAIDVSAKSFVVHSNLAGALEANSQEPGVGAVEAKRLMVDAVEQHELALERRDNAQLRYNLAVTIARLARTDPDPALVQRAEKHFRKALQYDPGHAEAHHDLGILLYGAGKLDEALGHYLETVRLDPDHASAHNSLGLAYARKARWQDAIRHYEESLRIAPEFPDTHLNLGTALSRVGRLDEAIEELRESIRLDASSAGANYELAVALDRQGDLDQAVLFYARTINLRSGWLEPALRLVWLLAADGDTSYRNPNAAIQIAVYGCRWSDNRDPRALDALGAAYASAGRFEEAVDAAERGIDLARGLGDPGMANAIEGRLANYREGRTAGGAAAADAP